MSSWMENQHLEALNLYRRYLGIKLHFKDGSAYDYTLYGGSTSVTLQTFMKKPKQERLKFIQLKNKLCGINVDEFLFSNARVGNFDINQLLNKSSLIIHQHWKTSMGTPETFDKHVSMLLSDRSKFNSGFKTLGEIAIYLLSIGDSKYLEAVAWIFQKSPGIVTGVISEASKNIFIELNLHKMMKIQKFYSYFGII